MSGRGSWVLTILVLLLDFLCRRCLSVETYGYQNVHSLQKTEEFTYHEVTVPFVYTRRGRHRRATTFYTKGHSLEEVFVQLTLFNKSITLELQLNKGLFGGSYIEKHFSDNGKAVIHQPQGLDTGGCYYRGVIQGQPDSVVAVSTCTGLRGLISSKEDVYYVEPQGSSLLEPHLIFRHSDMLEKNLTCGYHDDADNHVHTTSGASPYPPHARLRRMVRWPYDATPKTRIVELYITNDYQQYLKYDRDIRQVITRTHDIVNIVNSLYRPLNIYVALVGIEIWTEGDKSSVVQNADTTMNEFLKYRQAHICPLHKNDNAQLITGRQFSEGVVGKAVKSTICSFQYSGGVNMDHSKLVGPVATTVAHEMGHNFGMQHDSHKCSCPEERCIMAASSGSTNPVFWSSCSQEELADTFHQGLDYCLQDLPDQIYGSPTCGNGFVEPGEECDCGLPEDCSTNCCNSTTCQLHVNASCATGECCDIETCKVKKASTQCRPSTGECDLAEYCNGETEYCPHDVHRKNGEPCRNSQLYCYNGQCPSHDNQCKKLWGETGKQAHRLCYKHFNPMGLPNGHCGFNWVKKTFKSCQENDVMCGMLHCIHRNERLAFWKEALAYTMPEAWVMAEGVRQECKGAILDVGLDMAPPGMTPEGTKCGERKMCSKQKCLKVEEHDIPECPNCHGHGTCNTLGQCHCDEGYEPPLCNKAGNGGSLHSGPVRIRGTDTGLVAGLVIFFVIIIPGIIVLAIFVLRNKQKIKKLWNGRPYKYESRNDSFIHRAKRSGPTVTSGPPPARTPTRPAPVVPPQPAVVSTQPANLHRKRPQSFRGVEISAPKLESSTKLLEDIAESTLKDVGPRAVQKRPLPPIPGEHRAGGSISPPGGTNMESQSFRPVPTAPPNQPQTHLSAFNTTSRLEGKKNKKPVVRSQSVKAPPERPPPTYRDAVNLPLSHQSSFNEGQLPPPPSYPPPREPSTNSKNRALSRVPSNKRVTWQPALSSVTDQNQPDSGNTAISFTEGKSSPQGSEDSNNFPRFSTLCEKFDTPNHTNPVTTATKPVIRSSSMKGIKPPLPPKPPGGDTDASQC